jgi:hypothetical protein
VILGSEKLHVVTPCVVTLFSDHMTMCRYHMTDFHVITPFSRCFCLACCYDKLANLHTTTPNSTILAKLSADTPPAIIPLAIFYAASPTFFAFLPFLHMTTLLFCQDFCHFSKITLCSMSHNNCFIITLLDY